MKILFATSEAAPFAKSGGLGDVMGALPAEISRLPETEVAVIMPYYGSIKYNPDFETEYVTGFWMPLAWRNTYVGIFKATLKKKGLPRQKSSNVTYYFIDNESYFNRQGSIYGYEDDGERFAYFSKAVLEALVNLDFDPDIIHLNDWQTGFVPLFLKSLYKDVPKLQKVRTVYTIHNIEYQGKAMPSFLSEVLGVDESYRNICTTDNMINAMKTAIVLCDKLTTVSETYSHELGYAYFAHGLEGIIAENAYKRTGIINGIDTSLFNAGTDKTIAANFKPTDIKGKAACKAALQERLGLPVNPDIPIYSMVTRLVKHKGMELVERVAEEIAGKNIQFIVLGTGDNRFEDMMRFLEYSHPDNVRGCIMFDAALANQIYAGSDFFLMPSKSEPCGLSQMIAMRYGTIPIVRETGGLVDTVAPLNTETLEGRGFTFKGFNAHDMLHAMERAEGFFYEKNKLTKKIKDLMKLDLSWREPAQKYMAIYEEIKY